MEVMTSANIFELLYKELDIPDSYYEKANTSYKSLSNWLNRENSTVKEYQPEIYLQGSFKLGTVLKPKFKDDHYDIDIVCVLNKLSKNNITQEKLKILIGKEIESYCSSMGILKAPSNGKRCWTIEYHDEAQFHIDVLPCLNNTESYRKYLNENRINYNFDTQYIAITDKSSSCYKMISSDWEVSDPRGYAEWFSEKNQLRDFKKHYAESYDMKIEEIPDYKVKTPLQKSIQILKRHRDEMFQNDPSNRPSTIIITTLCALMYSGQQNIKDILLNFLSGVGKHIKNDANEYKLLNPTNPYENFADKWNTNSNLRISFSNWIKKLRKDLALYHNDIILIGESSLNSLSKTFNVQDISQLNSFNINKISNLTYKEKPKWIQTNKVKVQIKAKKIEKSFGRAQTLTSGEVLEKGVDLKFEAIASGIKDYDVFWQITNTGLEAQSNSCLRGDFCNGVIEEGKRIRKESTKYTGSHIVECYLVKRNECVGKSKPFIVNILNSNKNKDSIKGRIK